MHFWQKQNMYMLTVSENVLIFFSGFGILQGLCLAAVIYFHPKSDRSVNIFLAFYIIAISFVMAEELLAHMGWLRISFYSEPFSVFIGPLLYFYICSFKEILTWRNILPHFFLFIPFAFITIWSLSAGKEHYIASNLYSRNVLLSPLGITPAVIKLSQFVIYYFLAKRSLLSYQRSILHLYSETSSIELRWAKWLINGYFLLIAVTILLYFLIVFYPQQVYLWMLFNMALVTPYIYIITFKGYYQTSPWEVNAGRGRENVEEEMKHAGAIELQSQRDEELKLPKAGLHPAKMDQIVSGIKILMEQHKIYQEPELTLQQLADRLQHPSYQVSQAINEGLKKTFYDLINGYRVEEAKRLLLHPDNRNYTILSVGFEAGFNSKTTFNTVFKKFTGMTPTEYRDKNKMLASV
jgi:AraC-like DNA-binding protein